jgi:hypothetical protein
MRRRHNNNNNNNNIQGYCTKTHRIYILKEEICDCLYIYTKHCLPKDIMGHAIAWYQVTSAMVKVKEYSSKNYNISMIDNLQSTYVSYYGTCNLAKLALHPYVHV